MKNVSSNRVYQGDWKVFYVVIRRKHLRKNNWKTWNQNIKFDKIFWTVISSFIKNLSKGIGITKSNSIAI